MKIFFDTETSKLVDNTDEDVLIQLCYYNIDTNNFKSTYIKNDSEMSVKAMSIHHITPEMLDDKPTKEESTVFNEFKSLLESDEEKTLIAHNIKFDYQVILNAGIKPNNCKLICTMKAAEFINDQMALPFEQTSLQYLKYYFRLDRQANLLAEKLGCDLETLEAHDARYDVIDLVNWFLHIKSKFNASDESLIDVTENPQILKHVPFGKNRGELFSELSYGQMKYYSTLDGNVKHTADIYIKPSE